MGVSNGLTLRMRPVWIEQESVHSLAVPTFGSMDEADAWIERAALAHEIIDGRGPIWAAEDGSFVFYTTARVGDAFGMLVLKPIERPVGAYSRPDSYQIAELRTFRKRAAAKDCADLSYRKRSPKWASRRAEREVVRS